MKPIMFGVVLIALCAGGWAHAETADEREEARKAYRDGEAAFKANRLEEALAAFERGYELSHRPRFLLNMAHTQRKLGQLRPAVASYRRFLLTDPKPEERDVAKEMISEIEALLAEEDKLAASRTPEPTPPPHVAPEPVPAASPRIYDVPAPAEPADPPAFYERWPFWAGVGAVVVVGVVAGVLLTRSDSGESSSGSWGELRL